MRRRLPRQTPAALQRGMSLIEIIIVIVLIGLVLTVVGSRILGGSDRAKTNLAKSQLTTLAGKIEQFEMDTGRKPASLSELVTNAGATGWLGPYAKDAELKDPWNNAIQYTVPGESGRPYDLVPLGADGQPGGDSVNADVRHE
jgi:general secretion pathway protein G